MKGYVGTVPICFFSVSKTIVCLDDIERRGANLSVRDVLGLVLNLKEHKNSKVLLILNDEALQESKQEFTTFLEKVVDASLTFAPSAAECVAIALDTNIPANKLFADRCLILGISNIRIIRKIERLIRNVEPLLQAYDEEVFRHAVHSLALLGWAYYDAAQAPLLEYLKTSPPDILLGFDAKKPISEDQAKWNAFLAAYGLTHMDAFDHALLKAVQNGFFDEPVIAKRAAELDKERQAAKAGDSFTEAWALYHDSFDANEDEAINGIYQSFLKNYKNISAMNLDGTVRLFKQLGKPELAMAIIKHYMENGPDVASFFDLTQVPFAQHITDPEVIHAFNTKYATFTDNRAPASILLDIAKRQGWHPDDITTLARVTADDYYTLFKATRGDELQAMITACAMLDSNDNASPAMKEVKDALMRFVQE